MYNEILDELCDLATVVSRNYVYGKIKDRTGLSIRHISRIINHLSAILNFGNGNLNDWLSCLFFIIRSTEFLFPVIIEVLSGELDKVPLLLL